MILLPTLSWNPTLFLFSTDRQNPIGKLLKSLREKQSEPETFPLKIYLSIEQVFLSFQVIYWFISVMIRQETFARGLFKVCDGREYSRLCTTSLKAIYLPWRKEKCSHCIVGLWCRHFTKMQLHENKNAPSEKKLTTVCQSKRVSIWLMMRKDYILWPILWQQFRGDLAYFLHIDKIPSTYQYHDGWP